MGCAVPLLCGGLLLFMGQGTAQRGRGGSFLGIFSEGWDGVPGRRLLRRQCRQRPARTAGKTCAEWTGGPEIAVWWKRKGSYEAGKEIKEARAMEQRQET